MKDIKAVVADNLRTLREARGLTQGRLAQDAKVSEQTVQLLETRKRWISPDMAHKLAKALKVAESAIFSEGVSVITRTPEPEPPLVQVLAEIRALRGFQGSPTTLAEVLRSALNDSEFQDAAVFIDSLTGGRVQIVSPPKANKTANKR